MRKTAIAVILILLSSLMLTLYIVKNSEWDGKTKDLQTKVGDKLSTESSQARRQEIPQAGPGQREALGVFQPEP